MDVTRGRKTIRTIAASVDCKLRAVEEIEQARYEMGVAGTLRRFFEMVGQQASDIPDSGRTTMDEVMMAVGRGGKKVVMINDVQLFLKKEPETRAHHGGGALQSLRAGVGSVLRDPWSEAAIRRVDDLRSAGIGKFCRFQEGLGD